MARIQVTFPDEQAPLLDQRLATLRRPSRSYHAAKLIEDDLAAAGLLVRGNAAMSDEFIDKLRAAVAARPALKGEVEKLLARGRRENRRTAA